MFVWFVGCGVCFKVLVVWFFVFVVFLFGALCVSPGKHIDCIVSDHKMTFGENLIFVFVFHGAVFFFEKCS